MLNPSSTNIVAVYRRATDAQLAAGLEWYQEAHGAAQVLSPDDIMKGAGVIAALSPLKSWDINLRLAVRAFADGVASGHTPDNNAKANRILAGEHINAVLLGPKTNNFAHVIIDPTDPVAVVVDRHAFDIAVGRVTNDETRRQLSRKGEYNRFARAYQRAAKKIGVSPSQVQAVTWVVWRETESAYHKANQKAS